LEAALVNSRRRRIGRVLSCTDWDMFQRWHFLRAPSGSLDGACSVPEVFQGIDACLSDALLECKVHDVLRDVVRARVYCIVAGRAVIAQMIPSIAGSAGVSLSERKEKLSAGGHPPRAETGGRKMADVIKGVKELRQQGDVPFYKLAKLPEGLKPVEPKERGYIMAEGEVTGHAHVLENKPGVEVLTNGTDVFVAVNDVRGAQVVHEEHGTVTLPKGVWQVGRIQEYDHLSEEARQVRD